MVTTCKLCGEVYFTASGHICRPGGFMEEQADVTLLREIKFLLEAIYSEMPDDQMRTHYER